MLLPTNLIGGQYIPEILPGLTADPII